MGRKIELIKICENKLKNYRIGSFVSREDRIRVMKLILEDLARLKMQPENLYQISGGHIHALVDYWRSTDVDVNTILNRLSILRRVNDLLSLGLFIPTNQMLKLKRVKKTAVSELSTDDLSQRVYHPLVVNVVEMQMLFGVTKLEAIRLFYPTPNSENMVVVDRTIAANHEDRFIPVLTEQQKQCLAKRTQLTNGKLQLNALLPEAKICQLYHNELNFLGLDHNAPLRQHYARQRWNGLLTLDQLEGIKKIAKEMGIASLTKVRGMLQWV